MHRRRAHPDDIEIACGGILAKLVRQGHRVGIVDLTDGEPTPLSPGPEVRLEEARRAGEVLGIHKRINLDLPNRRLFDCFEARVALAKVFRRYKPKLVIGFAEKTPMASPDHYQAMLITEAAVFYSRLTKWDEHFERLDVHSVPIYLQYTLDFGNMLVPPGAGRIVVDITDTLETKLEAVRCYATQFPPNKAATLEKVKAFALQQGAAAGYYAGEILASPKIFGTRDLMRFVTE
ncbi:MAG: PIG-L family deacetylase [Pirellulales bacterium]